MNISIIIADDHQLFIDGLKSILIGEIGISVVGEANNGLELVQLLEDGLIPDVILTDIRMPILDGIAATRILHKKHPNLPILALSMYDQNIDVIEMLEAGAKGYVTKNVKKKELVLAVHTLIKGKYYFGSNLPKDINDWFLSKDTSEEKPLTRRETEILHLLTKGRTSIEMAKQLKISKYTVDTHRKNIHKKLGIKSNTGLVSYALTHL